MVYVNKDMRPYPHLKMERGFKPLPGTDREYWDVRENQSPSIRDTHFHKERAISDASARTKKEYLEKSVKVILMNQEKAAWVNKKERIALSRGALTKHIEERIGAFLMQIIDCYDKDLHFTIGRTENQTDPTSGSVFEEADESDMDESIELPNEPDFEMQMASAHHGTLPCLFAYSRVEWEEWRAQKDPNAPNKPEAFVYLKFSDTYFLNNACTGLMYEINKAENDYLDGNPNEKRVEFGRKKKDSEKKLREYAIEILNRAARKEIDPVQGFALFMARLKAQVTQLSEDLPNRNPKQIFQAWKVDLDDIQSRYDRDSKKFIAKLLGIRIPKSDRDTLNIGELVLPRHFNILQRKDLYQNQMAVRIDALRRKILALDATSRKNFERAFKLALMKHATKQSDQVRLLFQRYYNASGQAMKNLEEELRLTSKPALELVESEKAQAKIRKFFRRFKKYVHNFSIDESRFSSDLLKQVRLTKELSLRRFAQAYNKKFPEERRLNHEQLRRIESGAVKITSKKITQFAEVLKIHPSALYSGLVIS